MCAPINRASVLHIHFVVTLTGQTCFAHPHIRSHLRIIPRPLQNPFLLTLLILVLVSCISCCILSPSPLHWLLLPSLHPPFLTKPHLQYQVGHNTATLKTVAPFSSKISIATYKTTVSQPTRP